jgi:hypothetical protein
VRRQHSGEFRQLAAQAGADRSTARRPVAKQAAALNRLKRHRGGFKIEIGLSLRRLGPADEEVRSFATTLDPDQDTALSCSNQRTHLDTPPTVPFPLCSRRANRQSAFALRVEALPVSPRLCRASNIGGGGTLGAGGRVAPSPAIDDWPPDRPSVARTTNSARPRAGFVIGRHFRPAPCRQPVPEALGRLRSRSGLVVERLASATLKEGFW